MMFCKKCGEELEGAAKFCSRCGARQTNEEYPAASKKEESAVPYVELLETLMMIPLELTEKIEN